jgi:hypothetical protein
MQYAFVTLALTAATLAMPTKREALGGLDNIVNVGAVTSGLPVVSGLGLDVKRGIVDNTLSGTVGGTVGNVKDTVNGVKVGVQARDLVNGLVGNGVGGTVNGLLNTVGGLNVAKRDESIIGNQLKDVKDILHGVEVGAQVKRSVVGQVKDIVNDVNVDVATKRDLLNGLLGEEGIVSGLGLDQTVGDLSIVKRDALVDGLLSGLDLDQTLGNLPIVQRDLVAGTVTPLLNTVTDTVDGVGLGLKRDTGSALNLGSGAVGSVLGSNSGNADKTLGLNSGLVGGLTNGLNANHVVDNVVKRDSGNALNLGSGAAGSVLGSSSGNADKTLGLDSGLVGGLTNGLNLGNTVNNVVKRDSGNALNLGSGAAGSILGSNSGNADKTLGLDSGLVGGLTNGLNLGQTVGNVVKRDSGNALNLGSGAVGSVVGNNGDADKTLGLDSGLVGGLTNGLNANHVVDNVVKRDSGNALNLGSGAVGSVVGGNGNSDETLDLASGTTGGLTEGLNVASILDNVVKRQSGDVLGLASGTVGGVVGGQGDSSSVLGLKSGTTGGLTDGLNVNHIVEGVVKRQSGDVLGLASGTVGGVVGGQGDSASVLNLNSGTVGGLMDGLSLNHIVEGVVKRSIQELDVHSLIASLSDEQIKQLTAALPATN